ncbi:DUF1292 domain-containing protein [Lachnospiraceae bacterium JLR.KK008]
MEKIVFRPEGEAPVAFYVLEQTTIAGKTYILVTDTEEGDGDALILSDVSVPEDQESIYEIVTEETELSAVAEVFERMLEDVELTEGDFE